MPVVTAVKPVGKPDTGGRFCSVGLAQGHASNGSRGTANSKRRKWANGQSHSWFHSCSRTWVHHWVVIRNPEKKRVSNFDARQPALALLAGWLVGLHRVLGE